MKKVLKNTKSLLLENMVKLNPDFKLNEEDEKWIQKAINPEHKGFCSPITKPTCTSKRKALAKRFKKGIDETIGDYNADSPEYINKYKQRIDKIKSFLDELINQGEFEVIDTLYRLLVDKKHMTTTPSLNEDHSPEYQQKAEQLKGKIDFLFDTNHYDILDKIDNILLKIFPDDGTETEIAETVDKNTYFPTLSAALDAVRERVAKKGYTVDEDDMFREFGTGGISYGQTKRAIISLSKNGIPEKRKAVTIAIYRMDGGSYELTAYLN